MDEEKNKKGFRRRVIGFIDRMKEDHVSAYAAKAAYFLILAFIPFVLFLTTMIRYTPLSYNTIRGAIVSVVPQNLQSFVLEIVVDVYRRGSAVAPLSAIVALWSAGKGLQAITNGLNSIYHVKENRNWLVLRIHSVGYTLLFVIALIFSLLLLVLGEVLEALVHGKSPILAGVISRFLGARELLVFALLFVVFLLLYKVLPNRNATFRSQIPGALLNAVIWMVFSYLFSLYFELFPSSSDMYGNLTGLILIMLWLYICMLIMLLCAEFNSYFEKELKLAQMSAQTLWERRRELWKNRKSKP